MTVETTGKADAIISRLMGLHPAGFDLSLDRILALLARLDNPQNRIPPAIHIAGTNGKGSTTAFCRALVEASGKAAHVDTSPHLVNWYERYVIGAPGGGSYVHDDVLAAAIERVEAANDGQQITVFELLTAAGFLLFAEHDADYSVIEVGLGGRFDSTNVMEKPAVSVVTPVLLDHQAFLGDRVELIAVEKAGIFKRGVPAVIGAQVFDAAREVLVEAAERVGAPVSIYGQDFMAHEEHGGMVYQDEDGLFDLPRPALIGRHQIANAAAAIRAMKLAGLKLDNDTASAAMRAVKWPGRMQPLPKGKLVPETPAGMDVWIDGGHNPGAGTVIAEFLADMDDRLPRPLILICGMINTKDPVGFFKAFAGMAKHCFCVPVSSSDAGVEPDRLAAEARQAGLSAEPVQSVESVLALLAESWDEEVAPRVLICGSLYLIGEVLALNGTPPK